MFKRVGRPRKLDSPLPTKDMDATQSYEEDLSTEECKTDTGEFSFHFQSQNCCDGEKNLARANSPSPSSSPSSSSPSSSDVPSSSSSSETESDSDDDVWRSWFVRHCYQELRNGDMLRNLVENLYVTGCLPDFMTLINQLASGDLSPSNIAFLLCLERARWQSLKTTTQMRFRDVTKKFWLVVYRLLKGKVFNFSQDPRIMDK